MQKNVRYFAIEIIIVAALFAGDANACSTVDNCTNHATSVTSVNDGEICRCNCSTNWEGPRCDFCPAQYNETLNCAACAVGHINYPSCASDACSGIDCSNHSVFADGYRSTGCNCTCMNMYEGPTCAVCPERFDNSQTAMCSGCASGYDPWPHCFKKCGFENCSNHAAWVEGNNNTGCNCTCIPGWQGDKCEHCPSKYRQSDCAQCAEGLSDFPECSPICTNDGNCSGRALAVTGVVTKHCTCTCIPHWSGPECDFCDPERFSGENCDECSGDYSGSGCETLCSKEVNCSGHAIEARPSSDGQCLCTCRNNWYGPDCSLCPSIHIEWLDCMKCSAGEEYFGPRCEFYCANNANCSGNAAKATPVLSTGSCECSCRNQWTEADCSICPAQYDIHDDCGRCAKEFYLGGYPTCRLGCTSNNNCSGHALSVSGNPAISCQCVCRGRWYGADCSKCDSPPFNASLDCSACTHGRVRYPLCATITDELSASTTISVSNTNTLTDSSTQTVSLSTTPSMLCPTPTVELTVTGKTNVSSMRASTFVDARNVNVTLSVVPSPNTNVLMNPFSDRIADKSVFSVKNADLVSHYLHNRKKLSLIVQSPLTIDIYENSEVQISLQASAFEMKCTNGTVASANLAIIAEAIAIPFDTKQAVESVSTVAGTASVASLATTSALQLARANVMLTLSSCAFSHTAPLDRAISPTGAKIGTRTGQYYRGAIIANLGIIFGGALVHLIASLVIFAVFVKYRSKGINGLWKAGNSIFFPSLQVVPFCLLLPGTTSAALALWIHGQGDGDATMALVTLNVLLIIVVLFAIAVSDLMFEAGYEAAAKTTSDGKPVHWMDHYFLGKYRWIASGSYWSAWCYLFHTYRYETKWFVTVELCVSFFMGLLGGIRPEPSGCIPIAVGVVIASALMMVLSAKLKPHKAQFDIHHNAIHSTLMFVASLAILAARIFASLTMELAAQIVIIAAVILAVLRGGVYVIMWLRNLSWNEFVRMQRIERGEPSTFTYAFYPLWSPKEIFDNDYVPFTAPNPVSRGSQRRRRWNWRSPGNPGSSNSGTPPNDSMDLEVPMLNVSQAVPDDEMMAEMDEIVSPHYQSQAALRRLSDEAKLKELARRSGIKNRRKGSLHSIASPLDSTEGASLTELSPRKKKHARVCLEKNQFFTPSRYPAEESAMANATPTVNRSGAALSTIVLPDGQILSPDTARKQLEVEMGRAFLTSAVEYAVDIMFSSDPPSQDELEQDLAVLVGQQYAIYSPAILKLAVFEGSVL